MLLLAVKAQLNQVFFRTDFLDLRPLPLVSPVLSKCLTSFSKHSIQNGIENSAMLSNTRTLQNKWSSSLPTLFSLAAKLVKCLEAAEKSALLETYLLLLKCQCWVCFGKISKGLRKDLVYPSRFTHFSALLQCSADWKYDVSILHMQYVQYLWDASNDVQHKAIEHTCQI